MRKKTSIRKASSRYLVPMVVRVLNVFEAFKDREGKITLGYLVDVCHIPKATAFRVLETLRETGYVVKDDQGWYRLSYKLLDIALGVQEKDPARKIALPYLEKLRQQFAETVNMGAFEKDHVLYIEGLESPQSLRMSSSVGARMPINAAALGKAIAAWLPKEELNPILKNQGLRRFTKNTITSEQAFRRELEETAKRGYAIDDEEGIIGCRCVAVPIFDSKKRARWAISVSVPASRMNQERIAKIGKTLTKVARAISLKLGFTYET